MCMSIFALHPHRSTRSTTLIFHAVHLHAQHKFAYLLPADSPYPPVRAVVTKALVMWGVPTWGPSECCRWTGNEARRHPPWEAGGRRLDQGACTWPSGTRQRKWQQSWDHSCFFGKSWHFAGWTFASDFPHLRWEKKESWVKQTQGKHLQEGTPRRFSKVKTFSANTELSDCKFRQNWKNKHAAVLTDSADSQVWIQLTTRIKRSSCGCRKQTSFSPSKTCWLLQVCIQPARFVWCSENAGPLNLLYDPESFSSPSFRFIVALHCFRESPPTSN